MRRTKQNMKCAAGIALGAMIQIVMVVMFGFTNLKLPFLLYAGCWAGGIALIKWAAGNLPE